jgi:hypothetical protein
MTTAAAGDYAYLRCAILAVDDFVRDVALYGGICVRYAEESGIDEVRWVVDEVFC